MDSDSYSEQLCLKLDLETGVDRNTLQKAFVKQIGQLMLPGTTADSDAADEIKELFRLFGICNSEGIKTSCASSSKKTKDYPDAGILKSKAGSIVQGLYMVLGEFCICMLELNTTKAGLLEDIEAAKERSDEAHGEIQWSYDLPAQIAVSIRRRDNLTKRLEEIDHAEKIVFLLDAVLSFMSATLCDLVGDENAKSFLGEYRAKLKAKKLSAAKTFFSKRAEKETGKFFMLKKKEKKRKWALMLEIAELIGQLIGKCKQGICDNEGNVFLKIRELNVTYEATQEQLKKSQDFIAKYEIPEIRYRYDALERQRKNLDKIGPFEDKLQMIEAFEMACYSPMPTMKQVKNYEEGLYKQALHFKEQDAGEIKKIHDLMQKLSQGPDPAALSDEEVASAKVGD
jgi:hypothetical protein